jgi:hypothetical protein
VDWRDRQDSEHSARRGDGGAQNERMREATRHRARRAERARRGGGPHHVPTRKRPRSANLTEAGTDHFAALPAHAPTGADVAFEGTDPADLNTALTVMLAAKERAAALG